MAFSFRQNSSPVDLNFYYRQPGGQYRYLQPNGFSFYLQPA